MDNLEFEREYKIGKIWKGIKNEYYKNGTLKNEYIYSEGIIEGWKDYSSKGQIKFEGNYINGELKKRKEYGKREIIFDGEYKKQSKDEEEKNKSILIIFPYGKRWKGTLKEYDNSYLKYKWEEFLDGKRNGKGK